MKKMPWLKKIKKTDPDVPVRTPMPFGGLSNGEVFVPRSKKRRLMEKMVLERADAQSRYLGMDRREFLASSMGMATCMAVLNQMAGCSSSDGTANVHPDDVMPDGGGTGADARGVARECGDGPFIVPKEATCEPTEFLSGSEFVFDIQTHSFDEGEWREKNYAISSFLDVAFAGLQRSLAGCTEEDVLDCFNRNHYAELMFVDSETTMAVITSWPANTCDGEKYTGCGLPLSNTAMRELRDWLNNVAMSERVVNQVQVMPNDRWLLQKDIMTMAAEDPAWSAVSWKCYPAWKSDTYRPEGLPSGYYMDSDLGIAFVEHGLSLCIPNFCIHKGLSIPGFDIVHNQPVDIGPIAKMFPEANFIIYHSAINAGCAVSGTGLGAEAGCSETVPYDDDDPDPRGANMLIRSMRDNGIGPNENVYAELGAAWAIVSTAGDDSNIHLIGKLLKYVGEDNVVWGTDSILTGSPQWQIDTFRAFTIPVEYQDQFGYPELTPDIKAKILGRNAAAIFRIDPDATRCRVDASQLAKAKRLIDGELGPRRWAAKQPLGPRTPQEFLRYAREHMAKGIPG